MPANLMDGAPLGSDSSPGSTTYLPLNGEWLIVQMSPTAMVKYLEHPNVPALQQELIKMPLHTYLAVLRRYLETPSDKKPWHMVELFIMYSVNFKPPSHPTTTRESIADLLFPDTKSHYVFQSIYARLRTRVHPLPRATPRLMDADMWTAVCDSLMARAAPGLPPPKPIETRTGILERVAEPDCQPLEIPGEYHYMHPWDKDHVSGICLLPHFDYSFDVSITVSPGRFWEVEHAYFTQKLLEYIPTIPRIVRIPVRATDYSAKEYSAELHRIKESDLTMPPPPLNDHWKPVTPPSKLQGVIEGIGKKLRHREERQVDVVTIEKAYAYQVEKPSDAIWIRVPAKVITHEEAIGEEAKRLSEIKVHPPVRRQSIIPAANIYKTPKGLGLIDHKFYVPFVDTVALDVNVLKSLGLQDRSKQ